MILRYITLAVNVGVLVMMLYWLCFMWKKPKDGRDGAPGPVGARGMTGEDGKCCKECDERATCDIWKERQNG